MGETATKIQKLTNGAVQILNASDVVLATLMERSRVFRWEQQDLIQIVDTAKTSYKLSSADITDLIIDPNPPLPFSGTNQDLFRKLTEDFFIDVVTDTSDDDLNLSDVVGETVTDALNTLNAGGGGNAVDETNVKVINTPTYTVLSTDYILVFTVNCTVTLPVITNPLIAFPFRMFARGVTVQFNRSGSDLINNRTSLTIRRYQSVTLRALQLLDWGAGD